MKRALAHIKSISKELSPKERARFMEAYSFAKEAHAGQLRKSGRAYITHPVAVSRALWDKFHDLDLCIAGLLHDVVEDCEHITIDQIYSKFGKEIGFLVDAANKHESGFYRRRIVIEERVERLLWAGLQDVRALLLKIADRGHNIRTLDYLKNKKQVKMAFETQAIFAPLKKILCYDTLSETKEGEKKLSECMKKNKLSKPSDIKKFLYSMSFKEFSDEMYDLVYNNSDKVVWEIEDKSYLEELSRHKNFERYAKIDNMWTDGESFKAVFTFDKGYVMEPGGKLKVSSYKN